VNVVSLKTPFVRVAVSAVLGFALLVLPVPNTDTPRANAAVFTNTSGTFINGKISWICACSVSSTKPPELSSFDVQVDGVSNPVTSFTVFGSAIMDVTLTSPVYSGSLITFRYNAPATDNTLANNAFQKANGEDYESFTLTVTNMAPSRPAPARGNAPSWDTAPLTDSERDSNTVGIFPKPVPGNVIITNEFGFVVGKGNTIKPRIRMKNYAGTIAMTLTATYKDKGKNKTYTCKFQPFGTAKKLPSAKWRWYTPKKACVLPAALVTSIQSGKSTLKANATWKRQWFNGKKTKPSGARIKGRTLKYTLKGAAR
jgi:hypothetical protein